MSEQLKELFLRPQEEFTPIPFWFWNNALDEKEITRQIEDFHSKGINGFVIHPRMGIPEDIPYLSDRFMHYVKYAVSEAARLHMKIVLYDEAMYPSGSAHGMVVQANPEFAARCIRMTQYQELTVRPRLQEGDAILSVQAVQMDATGNLLPDTAQKLAVQNGEVRFCPVPSQHSDGTGQNSWNILVFTEGFSGGTIRGVHIGEDDGEANAPAAGDLLNPAAMETFIHITYDRYYEILKEYFGTTIIAMFTDEPDVLGRCHRSGSKPWTADFMDWWSQRGGREEDLPLLWLESGERSAAVRRQYQKAVNQRLADSYYSRISRWCEEHGISLTGHPQKSDDIGFLRYFHIPGQDIVWRWVAPEEEKGVTGRDSTMAKCSSDAARHSGRRRNSNECFGCCGPDGISWAFRADDMKWYLDWMFVRGVNLLYPHAFFYSLEGEKRYGERPPEVGPHNIWWKDYRSFSDYIKRMSWLMTDSVNTTPIAMLCEEDNLPWELARQLYRNQIEFNYLEDTLLRNGTCTIEEGCIRIHRQNYRMLVVENPKVLTDDLAEKLQPFVNGGGHLIICPQDLICALDSCCSRDIRIEPPCPDLRVSHVVKDDCDFYVLVNEGENTITGHIQVSVKGNAEIWDPWTGVCEAEIPEAIRLERRQCLILCVDGAKNASPAFSSLSAAHSNGACTQGRSRGCLVPPQAGTPYSLNPSWQITSAVQSSAVEEAGLSKLSGKAPLLPFPTAIDGGSLTSWTQWPGMEDFSGTVVYETSFSLEAMAPGIKWILDLGDVQETIRLQINEKDAGLRMWGPYRFDITSYISTGSNHIRLEITNTLANGMSGAKLPSGLLGPVTLLTYPIS